MIIKTRTASGLFILAAVAAMSAACGTDGPKPIGSGGGVSSGGNGAGSGSSPGGGNGPGTGGGSGSATGGALPTLQKPFFNGQGTWVQGASESEAGGAGGEGPGSTEIQGAFYILEDGVKDGAALDDKLMHSDFDADTGTNKEAEPSEFDEGTVKPCISGTAAQVQDGDFSLYWGGGIGLNLRETGGETSVKKPFNATAAAISGFEFVVSGDAGGADVRLKASIQDDPTTNDINEEIETNYCVSIKAKLGPGVIQVPLAEITQDCWEAGGTPVDPTHLMALQWQLVTDKTTLHKVKNFCIEAVGTY